MNKTEKVCSACYRRQINAGSNQSEG